MAKGQYLSKYGGSKSGYDKGKSDGRKEVLIKIGNAILHILKRLK